MMNQFSSRKSVLFVASLFFLVLSCQGPRALAQTGTLPQFEHEVLPKLGVLC